MSVRRTFSAIGLANGLAMVVACGRVWPKLYRSQAKATVPLGERCSALIPPHLHQNLTPPPKRQRPRRVVAGQLRGGYGGPAFGLDPGQ